MRDLENSSDLGEDSSTLLQQKSAQIGNNLAEQQVNNNNKAKAKQQTQEQLSSPLSYVLNTYKCGNCENCELNTVILLIYHRLHSHLYHMCRNLHKRTFIFCRIMYL